jgi:hypothetical protein
VGAAVRSLVSRFFILGSATATELALTPAEAWLLRSSVGLFIAMVAYCAWIGVRVNEAAVEGREANRKATDLDRRTAAIEEKLGNKG